MICFVQKLAKMPLDTTTAEHEILIKTIYFRLTKKQAKRTGAHWVDIGFQGTDPATDLRTNGMFGLLQMLYLVETYPKSVQLCWRHSNYSKEHPDEIKRGGMEYDFPLACKMLETTANVLTLLS